jgi:2-polyprenyl-3-methyl-5-hydroxy-6-metoxy-1,4-benzoquinol methylase
MSSAARELHDAMVAASVAQRTRIGQRPEEDRWTGAMAERFRSDPRREPEGLLRAFLEIVRPEDVVLDVGGGGGRFSLRLALQCREVINIDRSAGMHAVFDSVAKEAGISNARYVQEDWLTAPSIQGDVSIVSHVTYFVRDIETFIQKLEASTRRLIVIDVTATPNPNRGADVFKVTWGEEQALVPGYKELLPVLWEMNILPEVKVLPEGSFVIGGGPSGVFATRSDAIAATLGGNAPGQVDRDRRAEALQSHFDELFEATEGGFRQRYRPDQRQVLIIWAPNRSNR